MRVLFKYDNDNWVIAEVDHWPAGHGFFHSHYTGYVAAIVKGDLYQIGQKTSPGVIYCTILNDPNDLLKEIL